MRVTVTTGGGHMPGLRRSRSIDAAHLGAEQQAELQRLVAAARQASSASADSRRAGPGPARDAMSYSITVEGEGSPTELRASDGNMPRPFAELLDWVERCAVDRGPARADGG